MPGIRKKRQKQSGYMLLAIIIMATVLAIAAAAAAPSVAQEIKRQREEELVHRGTQYARAIKRFYKKFGRYPARIEELESTNNLRFLRKRYKDPITGSDQWHIIHYGEATIKPKMFGNQPVGSATPGSSTTGGSTTGTVTPPPASGSTATVVGTQGTNSTTGGPTATLTSASGPTFGGLPIVGVSSTSTRESLMELYGKNHYNEWEFVYDPRFDVSGAVSTGQQAAQPGGTTNQSNPTNQPLQPPPQPMPQPQPR
jgi:type II secretory pathway pseudopilin PulG